MTASEALEAIRIRCREVDRSFDWRETIADFADQGIADLDRQQEHFDKIASALERMPLSETRK